DRMVAVLFFLALSLILHFVMDMLALVGAIKKSAGALKSAFGLWMLLAFLSTLGVLGLVLEERTSEQDEALMPIVWDYLIFLAYGVVMYQCRQLLERQTDEEESTAPLLGGSQ
ncbi:hypothetical protein BGZ99_001706, partial [Dissophora globulifera]